ncbi:F-box protein At4g09920-like [Ricinus communis]|uniref:F-box protein At4g09920-like n=1 Tax=Ricinus communis TaxID=3988 RepID=UPI00201B3344|nr:F-box protein At4g09920-like [Ricinus communis]
MSSASKRQRANHDRISGLPEPVLCHILSFLDTVDAVKNSILSRIWRHTWTSVGDLEFHDSLCPNRRSKRAKLAHMKSFVDFMNRVLMLHKHPYIERLSPTLNNAYSTSDINSWISAAVTHNVEELTLSIRIECTLQLPKILFTCESLKVMKIDSRIESLKFLKLYSRIEVKIPKFVCLPSLKVIHLESLHYSSVKRLSSSCKVLEGLIIKGYSENLIDYSSRRFDIEVKNLRSVVEATLDLWSIYDIAPETFRAQMAQILRISANLKVLIIDKSSCHPIPCEALDEEQSVPRCLTSSLERFEFARFSGGAEDMGMLEYILGSAKILKTTESQLSLSIMIGKNLNKSF